VQSEREPQYLEGRIDSFLSGYAKTMADMTEAEFEGHKRSLITKRSEKLKNLDQESNRLWLHIDGEYFDFDLGTATSHPLVLTTTNLFPQYNRIPLISKR
jgi:insulysin